MKQPKQLAHAQEAAETTPATASSIARARSFIDRNLHRTIHASRPQCRCEAEHGAARDPAALLRRAIIEEIPRLRRYARSLLCDRDAADDLVHDCLETALSHIEGWRSGNSPRRQLFTIMHQLFIDQLRRTKRHLPAEALMPEKLEAVAAPARQPDKIASAEVLSALQQIAPERRAALTLVAVEGLSYADAANVLGISLGTLASRIAVGREELRSLLDDNSRR
ncbi:sigma-70 family RNA polymerase sigma factor [Mesorhizobium neociceri]|uniref:sigma-70 family RNA polymerase sigma factor n=1 Tax=Mesorhizobium neociceri TaxID=1307853 RepID=UPI002E2DEFDD|nr:sigma-70 family RNA polymerase sigma factor [Mesorhizobium neociceri]